MTRVRFPEQTGEPDGTASPAKLAFALCRRHFVAAAVFSAVLNLLYLAPTLYMLQVYDRVLPTRGFGTLLALTLTFAGAVLGIAALDWVRSRLLVRASVRLDRELAPAILRALLGRSPSSGRLGAALREFDLLKHGVTGPGAMALFDAPWAPIYIAVCFLLHPALGTFALGGTLLLLALTWLNQRATSRLSAEAQLLSSMSHANIDGSVAAGDVVRGLGMGQVLATRHLREREAVLNRQATAALRGVGYTSIVKAARLLLQSLALGLGALLAIQQSISLGAVFAASLLVARALAPIEQIIGAWAGMAQARGALRSLQALLDDASQSGERTQLPSPAGAVTAHRVTIVSSDETRALLNNVSFDLAAGEVLGIVGPSGAGKSVLARALVRADAVHNGAIRLDGASLAHWPEDQLQQAIGYLPQVPTLLRGTVKENIARFRTELGEEVDAAVIKATRLAGAHDFVLSLPHGYDTPVGPGGLPLSGGQTQRIALARALYGDPALLVLDEPNAAMDAEGERALIGTIELLRLRKTTVIIVAHRASVLRDATKLLVLKAGRVEHFGERDAVLEALRQPQPAAGEPGALPGGADATGKSNRKAA